MGKQITFIGCLKIMFLQDISENSLGAALYENI